MTDYTKLHELAQNATPGPYHIASTTPGKVALCASPDMGLVANRLTRPDAEFIAAANPTVVLALLDEIAALRRGQGAAPTPAGPGVGAFHTTDPIPDSTGGTR